MLTFEQFFAIISADKDKFNNLKKDLRDLEYDEYLGNYKGKKEKALIVKSKNNIKDKIKKLGKKYNQEAIGFGNLVYLESVDVFWTPIENKIKHRFDQLNDNLSNVEQNLENFDLNKFIEDEYPNKKHLLKSIYDSRKNYAIFKDYEKWLKDNNISKRISILLYLDEYKGPGSLQYNNDYIQNAINLVKEQSQKRLDYLTNLINNAIQTKQIKSNITILPEGFNDKNFEIQPISTFYIQVGDKKHVSLGVFFDENNNIELDDVLDAGEEDIFDDPTVELDYFNLANSLLNKPNKKLTLYRAIPKQDVKEILEKQFLPANVFLTSSFSDAEGIGVDFGEREIIKVVVDSNKLIQKLDGYIKHYQVAPPGTSAKISLY